MQDQHITFWSSNIKFVTANHYKVCDSLRIYLELLLFPSSTQVVALLLKSCNYYHFVDNLSDRLYFDWLPLSGWFISNCSNGIYNICQSYYITLENMHGHYCKSWNMKLFGSLDYHPHHSPQPTKPHTIVSCTCESYNTKPSHPYFNFILDRHQTTLSRCDPTGLWTSLVGVFLLAEKETQYRQCFILISRLYY